jgi:hypothetical protein
VAADGEVGRVYGASEPAYELDPGPPEAPPNVATGRKAPEHAI